MAVSELPKELVELTDVLHERGFVTKEGYPLEQLVLVAFSRLDTVTFHAFLDVICRDYEIANPFRRQVEMLPLQDFESGVETLF